jgi:metal-responsive CopG/Arc/MetJ family transcriptional regulator
MSARPVQISLDTELLRQIDHDPEAKRHGRSAFIRAAVTAYLENKRRNSIDSMLRQAYANQASSMADEVHDIMGVQASLVLTKG